MREMAPIGEMAPGCAKRCKKEVFKNPFAPGAISRMITVLCCTYVPEPFCHNMAQPYL